MMEKYKAKKSLGQHFLTSTSALSKILEAGNIEKGDFVIEVGPGKGILTEGLLKSAGKVMAIEKDRDLMAFLTEKFEKALGDETLVLQEADILDFDIEKEVASSGFGKKYKVIANIPYYITNAIIRLFLEATHQPSKMVLLVQKEVAERILARDGKESILSIAVKIYGNPKIIAKVPAGAFSPAPKVDSAILLIDNISKNNFVSTNGQPDEQKIEESVFFAIMRAGFAHKRKMLAGNLTLLYTKDKIADVFETLQMPQKIRAEDITTEDWVKLVREFSK